VKYKEIVKKLPYGKQDSFFEFVANLRRHPSLGLSDDVLSDDR